MCGLEPKQEAFSKAVFCWLRVRLLVYVEWATFVCSQVKYKNGTDACSAIDAIWKRLALSEQTRPTEQLAMCMPGSLPECSGTEGMSRKKLVSSEGGTACLGPHFSSLCCGLLAIQHAGNVADKLIKPDPEVSSKSFFTFLVKTPKRRRKRSWQNLKYLNPFSKDQEYCAYLII